MTLTPAYGRDYKSRKAMLQDFNADKDFIVQDFFSRWDGKPASRTDLKSAGEKRVNIRYNKLTMVAVVTL